MGYLSSTNCRYLNSRVSFAKPRLQRESRISPSHGSSRIANMSVTVSLITYTIESTLILARISQARCSPIGWTEWRTDPSSLMNLHLLRKFCRACFVGAHSFRLHTDKLTPGSALFELPIYIFLFIVSFPPSFSSEFLFSSKKNGF